MEFSENSWEFQKRIQTNMRIPKENSNEYENSKTEFKQNMRIPKQNSKECENSKTEFKRI